jgi:hypothetical protein
MEKKVSGRNEGIKTVKEISITGPARSWDSKPHGYL